MKSKIISLFFLSTLAAVNFSTAQVTCFLTPNDPILNNINYARDKALANSEERYKYTNKLDDQYFYPLGNRADGARACRSHGTLNCSTCQENVTTERRNASSAYEAEKKAIWADYDKEFKVIAEDYCKKQVASQKAKDQAEADKKARDEAKKTTANNEQQEKDKAKARENSEAENKAKKAGDEREEKRKAVETYNKQKTDEREQAKTNFEARRVENNAAVAAVAGGVFKFWELFQDDGKKHHYESICSHFAVDLGVNIISMPLLLNESTGFKDVAGTVYKTENTTTADSPIYTNLLVGVNYYPLLSNKLSAGFKSKVIVGPSFEALAGGGSTSGSSIYRAHGYDLILQGGTEIQIGRFLTTLDFIRKEWEYTTSLDVFDNFGGSISVATGSSKSTTVRYGFGFRLFKLEKETNLDLQVLLDNLSYHNNTGNIFSSPILFRLALWDQSLGKLNVEFSPSYPTAGIPLYSDRAFFKPHFSVDLLLNITRFKFHNIDFNYTQINQSNERRGELIGFIDYSSLNLPAFSGPVSGLGVNLKYKKVINSPKRENYIDFQMSGDATLASTPNEFADFEMIRVLNFSPDLRFTKKIIPSLYVGLIAGLNSLSVRNTIPYYDASVIFDSQRYFLQGSIGATFGLMYSRKSTLLMNYYFRPAIIGSGSQSRIELELAYKVMYFNFSYINMPEYNAGYKYDRKMNIMKIGIGCRMPW